MTSSGTSIFATSPRKSVAQVATQSYVPFAEAPIVDEAGLHGLRADARAQQDVGVVEGLEEVREVGRTIGRDRRSCFVEDALLDALRVVVGLEQERCEALDQHGLADACGAERAEIPGHLACAHRVPDQHCVVEVELLHQRAEVGGEGVVVVAGRHLARCAEAAPVVGDHAKAGVEQRNRLSLPGGAAERESGDQHYRPAGTVVLVVQIDRSGILGADVEIRASRPPA
jgi:hypothetical protein